MRLMTIACSAKRVCSPPFLLYYTRAGVYTLPLGYYRVAVKQVNHLPFPFKMTKPLLRLKPEQCTKGLCKHQKCRSPEKTSSLLRMTLKSESEDDFGKILWASPTRQPHLRYNQTSAELDMFNSM